MKRHDMDILDGKRLPAQANWTFCPALRIEGPTITISGRQILLISASS